MKKNIVCLFLLSFSNIVNAIDTIEKTETGNSEAAISYFSSSDQEEAQAALQYFLDEVEKDEGLSYTVQLQKIQEFKSFADQLSPGSAQLITLLLLDETRLRVENILQNAGLTDLEIDEFLADYEEGVSGVKNMTVEIARQMLFFVNEFTYHRQYVYEFGAALGCPIKQLLRHDLCKLSSEQFEGYARYFRGGRLEEDKPAFTKAWQAHLHEEHHLESYNLPEFNFDTYPEEKLRNNMLETVADLLAATKQRGGGTLLNWLVTRFPKSHPHPKLLPYLEEALKKAHALYLESENNPDTNSIFKDFPCWNTDVEEVFEKLKQ